MSNIDEAVDAVNNTPSLDVVTSPNFDNKPQSNTTFPTEIV